MLEISTSPGKPPIIGGEALEKLKTCLGRVLTLRGVKPVVSIQ